MSSTSLSRPLSGLGSVLARFGRGAGRLVVSIELALQVRKERQMLLSLDDHLLKDVGFNRSDVHCEGERAIWDVPIDRLRI